MSYFKQIWKMAIYQVASLLIWVLRNRYWNGDLQAGFLLMDILFCIVLNFGGGFMFLHGSPLMQATPGDQLWSWQDNRLYLGQFSKMLDSWGLSTDSSASSWGISPSVLKGDQDSVPHGPLYLVRAKMLSIEENVLISYYLEIYYHKMFSLMTFPWE